MGRDKGVRDKDLGNGGTEKEREKWVVSRVRRGRDGRDGRLCARKCTTPSLSVPKKKVVIGNRVKKKKKRHKQTHTITDLLRPEPTLLSNHGR